MANKILNTRIQLRYDTYVNWTSKNPTLAKGEVALVEVPEKVTDPQGTSSKQTDTQSTSKPQILMKVGDGISKFLDLPWTTAMSGDVYAWAKAENPGSSIAIEGMADDTGNAITSIGWDKTNEKLIFRKSESFATSSDLAGAKTELTGAIDEKADSSTVTTLSGSVETLKTDLANQKIVTTTLDTAVQKLAKDVTNKADKATTLAGYKITDAYTKKETDTELSSLKTEIDGTKANKSDVYTKKETDTAIESAVTGAVQYWGVASKAADLGKDMTASGTPTVTVGKGDFYRVGAVFNDYAIGDLLIANKDKAGSTIDNYYRLKQENGDGTVTEVAIENGGGLSVSDSPITSRGTITVSHAVPTSASAGSHGSSAARTYLKAVTTDEFGHVTGVTTGAETVVDTWRPVKIDIGSKVVTLNSNATLQLAGGNGVAVIGNTSGTVKLGIKVVNDEDGQNQSGLSIGSNGLKVNPGTGLTIDAYGALTVASPVLRSITAADDNSSMIGDGTDTIYLCGGSASSKFPN